MPLQMNLKSAMHSASSDADFLVEFAPDAQPGLGTFFGAKADLERLLGLSVDLVEPGSVRNREAIYAA